MKKVIITLAMAIMSIPLFAQIPLVKISNPDDFRMDDVKIIKEPAFSYENLKSSSREDIKSEWYSFTSALNYYLGGTLKYYSNYIFPDSLPRRFFTDGDPQYLRWHSVGISFDPNDELYSLFGQDRLLRRQPYTLDSIAFRYIYEKHNDNDLKDELVIQIYHTSKVDYYSFTTSGERFATVEFDSNTLSGLDFHQEIKYELDYDDTATFEGGVYKWLQFPVNLAVPKPSPMHANVTVVTLLFKPKYSYNLGDTFTAPTQPYKKLNSFWYQQFYDESSYNMAYYSNGLMMNYQIRYDRAFGYSYGYRYLPGSAWESAQYPYILFKITYDKDYVESINDPDNSFKVARVYPNPSVGNANLDINLDNTAIVSIDVLNTLGQIVNRIDDTEYTAGEHKLSFSTSDLNPGVYVVRVTVNGVPTTQSLIIE